VIVYLDTSVILRILLKESNELSEWAQIRHGITSELTTVECHRGLHRARSIGRLDDNGLALAQTYAREILNRLTKVNITPELLERAEGSLPGMLAALDAIHLVSAMTFRDRQDEEEPTLVFATHDRALAAAAESSKFEVLGA
jgi:predicted nucleic acid-binding protein